MSQVTAISEAEARELTAAINRAVGELWRLLHEAYIREAWRALGYASWREYATTELTISKTHAYRLLDQGRVILAIAAAADPSSLKDSPMGEKNRGKLSGITERQARDVKPHLDEVTGEVRERVGAGEDPDIVVPEAIDRVRRRPPEPEPDLDAPDPGDAEIDEKAEIVRLAEENAHLYDELELLRSDDTARELSDLRRRYHQLDGRLQQALTTARESQKTARYATSLLRKVREALGVERNAEILPALRPRE